MTWNFSWSPASQISAKAATNDTFSFHPNPLSRGYVANGLNQYTKTGGVTPTYDARGNLTTDSVGSYGYDLENHLLTASAPTAVTLAYDPLGRLQSSTAAGATTTFLGACPRAGRRPEPGDGDDLSPANSKAIAPGIPIWRRAPFRFDPARRERGGASSTSASFL